MRLLATALVALLALTGPAAAQPVPIFDDPRGLVEYAYEPYRSGGSSLDNLELFTPTLRDLLKADADRTEEPGMEEGLDFDPFLNAQDVYFANFKADEAVITNDHATVDVTFSNGSDQHLQFMLERRAEGWKIDDIASVQPGYEWRLSEILAADPMLN